MTTFEDVLRCCAERDVFSAWVEPSKHGEPGLLLCMLLPGADGLPCVKDWAIIEDQAEDEDEGDEAPYGYCLDHGGPHPCGSCGQDE